MCVSVCVCVCVRFLWPGLLFHYLFHFLSFFIITHNFYFSHFCSIDWFCITDLQLPHFCITIDSSLQFLYGIKFLEVPILIFLLVIIFLLFDFAVHTILAVFVVSCLLFTYAWFSELLSSSLRSSFSVTSS